MQSQFSGSDTIHVAGTITDYKEETSYVADTDASLPDKLNIFFASFKENNTEPPSWAPAAQEDYGFPIIGLSSMAASPDSIPSCVPSA